MPVGEDGFTPQILLAALQLPAPAPPDLEFPQHPILHSASTASTTSGWDAGCTGVSLGHTGDREGWVAGDLPQALLTTILLHAGIGPSPTVPDPYSPPKLNNPWVAGWALYTMTPHKAPTVQVNGWPDSTLLDSRSTVTLVRLSVLVMSARPLLHRWTLMYSCSY